MGNFLQNTHPQEMEEYESVHQPIPIRQKSHLIPSKPLRTGRIKPIIANNQTWRCLLPTDLTLIMKYKPKIISNIHLTCLDDDMIGIHGLRTLCKSLKDAKNVSSLTINTKAPNTKQLSHLLNITNRWKKLKFHYNQTEQNLNKETIKNLTRLRRCPDLSTLDISFGYKESNDVIEETISSLSQQIRGLSHFKSFKVSFLYEGRPERNDVDYYTPFFYFRYPRSLKSLTLNFNHRSIRQQGQDIFLKNIQQLNSLEHLDISFSLFSTSIEPHFWDKFFDGIHQIKSLRFCDRNSLLSEEETEAFFHGFRKLKTLNSLELILDRVQTESQVYMFTSSLCQQLAALQNLKSFSLKIFKNIDPQHELVDLLPSIQNFSQLERPRLRLFDSDRINCFLQSLQYLHNLRHLDICVANWYSVTKEPTIFFLAGSLQKLTNLQTLNVSFPNLDQDAFVEILIISITQLNLNSLSFVIGEKQYIINPPEKTGSPLESTKKLITLLSRSNLLSNLSINLSTFDLSVRECRGLSLSLQELKQLNSLSLVLPNFNPANKFESIQAFLLSIRKIPKLTSLSLQFDIIGLDHKAIHNLASGLGDCAALESLNLSLGVHFEFHREMFRSLLFGIADLSSLRNLQLYLGGITTHVQAPPDDVFQELKDLKNLETLSFVVSWQDTARMIEDFSQGSLEVFREKLEKYPNYKRLIKLRIVENVEIPCNNIL